MARGLAFSMLRLNLARACWAGSSRVFSQPATGPNNELRWHDGFVVEVQGFQLASPAVGRCYKYRLYYKVDSQDEWVEPPFDDKTLCFRKPHLPEHKMPEREIMRARRCMQAAEVAAAEAEAGTE